MIALPPIHAKPGISFGLPKSSFLDSFSRLKGGDARKQPVVVTDTRADRFDNQLGTDFAAAFSDLISIDPNTDYFNASMNGHTLIFGSGVGGTGEIISDPIVLAHEEGIRRNRQRIEEGLNPDGSKNFGVIQSRKSPERFVETAIRAVKEGNGTLAKTVREALHFPGDQWREFFTLLDQKSQSGELPEGVTYESFLGQIEELAAYQRLEEFLTLRESELEEKAFSFEFTMIYVTQTLAFVLAIEHALNNHDVNLAKRIISTREGCMDGGYGTMSSRDLCDYILANRIFGWVQRDELGLTPPEQFAVTQVWEALNNLAKKSG